MNAPTTHYSIALGFAVLFLGLAPSLSAAALTKIWTYDSGVLPDGRAIINVGQTPTVGTDGSLAFSVFVESTGNSEYSMFWFEKDQADPLNPVPIYETDWDTDQPKPVAIRLNHLIYIQAGILSGETILKDHLYSIEKGDTLPTLIDSFVTDQSTSWMIEQSRGPGVLYIFEAELGDTSFKVHAYQIDPVNTDELLVPTIIGVLGGSQIQLEFPTVADAMYQIQTTTDLVAVPWTDDGAQIVGNGANLTIQRPAPVSGNVFYRIRKL